MKTAFPEVLPPPCQHWLVLLPSVGMEVIVLEKKNVPVSCTHQGDQGDQSSLQSSCIKVFSSRLVSFSSSENSERRRENKGVDQAAVSAADRMEPYMEKCGHLKTPPSM